LTRGDKVVRFILWGIGILIGIGVLASLSQTDALISIILIVFATVQILAIVAFFSALRLRRDSATKEELAELTRRIYALERAVEKLATVAAPGAAKVAEAPAKPEAKPAPIITEAKPIAVAPPAKEAPAPVMPKSVIPAEILKTREEVEARLRAEAPQAPPPAATPKIGGEEAQLAAMQEFNRQKETLGQFPSIAHAETKEEKATRWADLEERVGTNWFNKVGMAVLILGIAYFLNYVIKTLPAGGKIVVAYAVAAALLGAGIWGEKRERYRILARGALGGGWALAYFTTYAMHNIEAVKIVESPVLGFFLLFLVAVAMVGHSLRYNSQVVTGLAYLLAFASVAVSTITVGALIASALLAASLVAVLARRDWYLLELPAIVATYAVHWVWLFDIFEKMGGRKRFPEFAASVAILSLYWVIFTVSHFLREDKEAWSRRILTGAFLLNLLGYLAVMRYQSLFPEWRFRFLLTVGVIYVLLAFYSRSIGRRLAFLLTSTVGASLLLIAIPYKYSGSKLELIWVVEAQAFLLTGWRIADKHLRRLGWGAFGALATYVLFNDYALRTPIWEPPDWETAIMMLVLAAAYFLNAYITPRKFAEAAEDLDHAAAKVAYGVGTGMLLGAVWFAAPMMWVAVLWGVILLALHEAGRRLNEYALTVCGHIAALMAVARMLAINLQFAPGLWGMSLRVLTIGAGTAMLYWAGRQLKHTLPDKSLTSAPLESVGRDVSYKIPAAAYSWAGTVLFASAIWNEVATGGIALAWALYGLALLEVGRAKDELHLRAQGHALLFLSFARIFFADLNVERSIGLVSARLLTVTILAVMYYYAGLSTEEKSRRLRAAYVWCGMVSLVALARFELPLVWVAVGWAGLALVVFVVGEWAQRSGGAKSPIQSIARTLRVQSYVITLLVALRCGFDNFYQTGEMWFRNVRTITVVAACVILYALLWLAKLRIRRSNEKEDAAPDQSQDESVVVLPLSKFRRIWNWMDANAHQLFFFVPTILLTILLSLEVDRGYLTAAWGLEAFVVFVAALKLGERTFRWFSLGLFALALGRIAAVDFWTFDQLGRIVSLIGLGAALLTVSFLYARFRELWRKYM
jgi:uncharacterized membrane protein